MASQEWLCISSRGAMLALNQRLRLYSSSISTTFDEKKRRKERGRCSDRLIGNMVALLIYWLFRLVVLSVYIFVCLSWLIYFFSQSFCLLALFYTFGSLKNKTSTTKQKIEPVLPIWVRCSVRSFCVNNWRPISTPKNCDPSGKIRKTFNGSSMISRNLCLSRNRTV